MAYDTLKAEIRQYIKTNGANEITGQILQNVLLDMVNAYPSLDGYATQQWVQNQLSDMATMTWVGQQGFVTNSALADYLPLSGGVMTGFIIAGELSTGSYSLGYTGLDFSYSYNGNPRYAHGINISPVNNTITFSSRGVTGTVIGTSQITSDRFIVSNGTSSQFLKADGSVDNNTYLSSADLSGYATETWVGANYLALSGGTMTGFIGAGTLDTGSYSLGNTGLVFEYSSNGSTRYAHKINISSVDNTITFYGRNMTAGTVIETNQITSDKFIVTDGTSAQFLKADGSVDSNTYLTSAAISDMATQTWVSNNYLPLTGGTIIGNLSVLNNLYVGTRLTISAEGGTPEDPESFEFWLDNGEINIDNQTVITRTNITANAFIQTSDITKKNILSNVGLSLHNIADAPLFNFTWKDSKDQRNYIGTSAQYWQKVIPEVVSEEKRGVLGLQYDVAALAGVITVAKRVVDHEARIAELEKENALLKEKLNIN